MPNISWLSRLVGVGPRFQRTLIDLLSFGYKCRYNLYPYKIFIYNFFFDLISTKT